MFGVKLKQLREQKGLSQKQLADAAGLSQRAVSHWEQGLRQPTWDAVQALCDALGVDCTSFRDEPGDTEAPQPAQRGRPRKGPAPEPPAPGPGKRGGATGKGKKG